VTDGRERLDEGMQRQQQLPEPAVDMDMSDTEIAGNTATTTAAGTSCRQYYYSLLSVFLICDILVQTRIGSGSVTLSKRSFTYPDIFVSDLQDTNKRLYFLRYIFQR
jgi:hypothetical protein